MARDVKPRARSKRGGRSAVLNDRDVFINCPFDADYNPTLNAIIYTIIRSGYRARCSLERDDSGENRLFKIIKIIRECRFAVHDISRTEVDGDPPLPRFNMPLELGLWLGATHLGEPEQQTKSCIVFDIEPYRFQKYISDIAGQDIQAHSGSISKLITELSAWLRHLPGGTHPGGGEALMREYQTFEAILPDLCARMNMTVAELKFADFNLLVVEYVTNLGAPQAGKSPLADLPEKA